MFDDLDQIEFLHYDDYRKALYYLKNPKEYEGDYEAFCDKLVDYVTRVKKYGPIPPLTNKDK